MTEVIAIEDWVLPNRTFPAARNADDYRQRLIEAERGWTTRTSGCSPGATTSSGTDRSTAQHSMR